MDSERYHFLINERENVINELKRLLEKNDETLSNKEIEELRKYLFANDLKMFKEDKER